MSSLEILALSAFVSAAIASAIVFAAKTWLSVQIEKSITLRYDTRFEDYRRDLQTSHEAALKQLQGIHDVASGAFIQGQRVAAEHRIAAIESFWIKMVDLRKREPPVFQVLDILQPEEFDLVATKPKIRALVDEMSFESIVSSILGDDDTESLRPFIGEHCFSIYYWRRALMFDISVNLIREVKTGKVRPWFKDQHILHKLSQILDNEEISEFISLTQGHWSWLRAMSDRKALEALRMVISGQLSANEGVEQALKIQETASDMADRFVNRQLLDD